MKVLIIGGGIGGLALSLYLHERNIECEIFEQAETIRELGVGINTLPHAIKELVHFGLLDRLDEVAVRTRELIYVNRFGQEILREPRGIEAGYDVPQFSIHRGHLQGVLHEAALERLGAEHIHTNRRLVSFEQNESGVSAHFKSRNNEEIVETVHGDVMIGADGIHSVVRSSFYPDEGAPQWNGIMLWRGATEWPSFLTGQSMVVAGDMKEKLVLYPIANRAKKEGHQLINWAVAVRQGDGTTPPPRREDWSREGKLDELMPHVQRFEIPYMDVPGLIKATDVFYEYPMCDRDPLPQWSFDRVTIMGDAAHPMYPVGSNGASQAILDAKDLAARLDDARGAQKEGAQKEGEQKEGQQREKADHQALVAALKAYEHERLPVTANIVAINRKGGPERVVDIVSERAPNGFEKIEDVVSQEELDQITKGYQQLAGFDKNTINKDAPQNQTSGGGHIMTLTAGVSPAGQGIDVEGAQNISWDILGQTYVPKSLCESSFSWHAHFPPGTFVPPHIHPTQDEFIYLFEGQFDLVLDGQGTKANAGDLVRLPMGIPHGIFNNSEAPVKCLFWVSPTRKLFELFTKIHNVSDPEEVVRISAQHEVDFLPPPEEGA